MKVIAHVRKVGAIGVFYPVEFHVRREGTESLIDAFLRLHGEHWEFHHWDASVASRMASPAQQKAADANLQRMAYGEEWR